MKKRSSEILQKLLLEETTHSIGQYAKFYSVTERTIRADIKEINTLLEQLNFPSIRTVESGLILVKREVDYSIVLQHIKKMGYYYYRLSPKERQIIIIFMLINKNSHITMNELSDSLFVSRLTIMSDIAEIKDQLKPYNIQIISKSKGLRIRFDEKNVRSLIVDILKCYFENLRDRSVFQNMLIRELSDRYSLDVISKSVQKIEKKLSVGFSNEGFKNLVFYLFVSINRFSTNDISSSTNVIGTEEELQLASHIYNDLANELGISIEKKEEIAALANFMKEKNIYPLSNNISDYPELYIVIANFLFSVQKSLGISITKNHDYDLFEFLVFHIKEMAERLHNDEKVQNPLCQQIISEYSNVYNATKENIYLIEKYLGCNVDQDEIAFITMHISAAIERNKAKRPQLSIVVACPGSMATGHLLATQIEKYFNFDIREIIAADRLLENGKINDMDIDFIVSSVPLPASNCPILVVNPILQEEDYISIQSLAFNLYKDRENSSEMNFRTSMLENFPKAIEPAKQQNQLIFRKKLQTFYQNHIVNNAKEQETPFLYQIIRPKLISVHTNVRTWRNAIRKGGELLVRNGYTTAEYINSMIETIEEYGPYCVIRKGLAIAHAEPHQNVLASGMSLLVLKNGVCFGHEDNDPVYLLFCFCIGDSQDYLKALNDLIEMCNDNSFFLEMFKAKDNVNAFEILKSRELNLSNPNKVIVS